MRRESGTRRRLSVSIHCGRSLEGSTFLLGADVRRHCCARRNDTKGLPVQPGPVFTMAGTLPPTSIPSRLSPTNVELPCVTPLRC